MRNVVQGFALWLSCPKHAESHVRRNVELLMKDFVGGLIAESFTRSIVESLDMEGKCGGADVENVLFLRDKLTK